MSRTVFFGIRSLCIVGAIALASLAVQPYNAAAQPVLSLGKQACVMAPGLTCSSAVTAAPGATVQYNLNYANMMTAGATAGTVTITDVLQPGQTYTPGSCTVPGVVGATCTFTPGPGTAPGTVTFVIPAVAPGTGGTVTFAVTVNPGVTTSISNQATATAAGAATVNSNFTTIAVNSTLTVTKTVRDLTTGSGSGTSLNAGPSDQLRYTITVTNNGAVAAGGVSVSDTVQGAQAFTRLACTPSCTYSGNNTITFTLGNINPGASAVATFDVTLASASGTIPNTATATAANAPTATSNTTTVTIQGTPVVTPTGFPCSGWYYGYCTAYPYPTYYCAGYPYNPAYLGYCNGNGYGSCPLTCGGYPTGNCGFYSYCPSGYVGNNTICGLVTSYTPASAGVGYLTINGEVFTLMPLLQPTGSMTAGGSYCLTFTVNSAGQVASLIVNQNLAGTNYICGGISPFSPGYNPYPGFQPYTGYNPYVGYGSAPGYGPYMYSHGSYAGYYGWGGPVVVGGYPFQVYSGSYFPSALQYGNPYCFTMNTTGYVTGSLSVVPTAAHEVQSPNEIHHVGKMLAG